MVSRLLALAQMAWPVQMNRAMRELRRRLLSCSLAVGAMLQQGRGNKLGCRASAASPLANNSVPLILRAFEASEAVHRAAKNLGSAAAIDTFFTKTALCRVTLARLSK